MALFLRVLLAVLEVLPKLLGIYQERRKAEKRDEIDADPVGEFESEFGKLPDDNLPAQTPVPAPNADRSKDQQA